MHPLMLNLGAGKDRIPGTISVDAYGDPDVKHDLCVYPYPWAENSVDVIEARHVFEHLPDWWGAFRECARILKPGGVLNIRVPHQSSDTAMGYRDHLQTITMYSFHGCAGYTHGTNAWAEKEQFTVPLRLAGYHAVPFPKYAWMVRWCPWLLAWCGTHLRNFIWEQRFCFRKLTHP